MQPEDIDKLFRERLAGHAPTPPAFVWAEIEAEIQPAKRRRPVMWLAAASVALLVLLGAAGWLLTGGPAPTLRPGLATTTPARVPAASAPAAATAPNNTSVDQQPLLAAAELNDAAQATVEATAPSGPSEATATVSASGPAALVATTVRATAARPGGVQPGPAADRRSSTSSATVASGLPANEPAPVLALAASAPELPETKWVAQKRPAALPTATVALTGPIEVDVRPAYAAPQPAQPARRHGVLAVLRQVRNVVQGEPVSLTAAGLPETVTVQARLAGRTLTKTIQL
ncbi:hypothetical protein [Hymenobacter psychrophilus]|uniref:Uncharacterized protein n=1 Tax=Hymenobacter psychrophilus TaxID=651662 RepID=A0A1H3LPI3_9BACT|nr:hypothetical protein [Hymenobacter psychrophilus]SDY66467.1 hypothetical protein SAMN04488069_11180 [Hymenobacter psychrophilus]